MEKKSNLKKSLETEMLKITNFVFFTKRFISKPFIKDTVAIIWKTQAPFHQVRLVPMASTLNTQALKQSIMDFSLSSFETWKDLVQNVHSILQKRQKVAAEVGFIPDH